MFTGIIEELGTVVKLDKGQVSKIAINCPLTSADIKIGDSVSVNGICLSVTKIEGSILSFDIVEETMRRGTLFDLKTGDRVNIESSLKVGKPIGGHFVLGHVDGVGVCIDIKKVGESVVAKFSAPNEVIRYVVKKGSIAVDGISLTVADCSDRYFTVALIPHTLSNTTLYNIKVGQKVNLEADILGKYVEKLIAVNSNNSINEDFLKKAGFI